MEKHLWREFLSFFTLIPESYPYLRTHFPPDVSYFGMLLSDLTLNTLDLYLWISVSPPPQTACHLCFPSFEKANRASFHLWRCESSKQRRFSFQSSTLPSDPFVPDSNSPCSSCFIKKHFYLVFALESLMNVVERVSLQTSPSSPFVNRYQKLLQMWCFLPFKSFARINYADKCFSRV